MTEHAIIILWVTKKLDQFFSKTSKKIGWKKRELISNKRVTWWGLWGIKPVSDKLNVT